MNQTSPLKILALVFLMALLVPALVTAEEELPGEWELVLSKKGVDAYIRSVPNSKVMEVRAVTVLPARLEVVAEVLRDVEQHTNWRPNCQEARILRQENPYSLVVYDSTNLPWPLKDREVILACEVELDPDNARGTAHLLSTQDDLAPPRKDRVRITELYAQYILQYIGEEKTGLVFTTRVHPAGSIPLFLVNSFSKYYSYAQLLALREEVKKPLYIERAKNSPDKAILDAAMANEEKRRNVLKNRLGHFIEDSDFIDMVVNDQKMFDHVFAGGKDAGRVGEIILFGWGSEESRQKAVSELLRLYLSQHMANQGAVDRLASDQELIDRILSGQGYCSGSVAAYLQNEVEKSNRES